MTGFALIYNSVNLSCVYDLNFHQWIEYDRKDKETEKKLMEKYQITESISMDTMVVAVIRLKNKFGSNQISIDYQSHLHIVPLEERN